MRIEDIKLPKDLQTPEMLEYYNKYLVEDAEFYYDYSLYGGFKRQLHYPGITPKGYRIICNTNKERDHALKKLYKMGVIFGDSWLHGGQRRLKPKEIEKFDAPVQLNIKSNFLTWSVPNCIWSEDLKLITIKELKKELKISKLHQSEIFSTSIHF